MNRFFKWVPFVAGTYSLTGGLLTLMGWCLNLPRFADWDGDGIAMQPNSAVAAIFAGSAMLFVASGLRKQAVCLGVVVLPLGAATLFQHLTAVNLGIDGLLLFDRPWGSRATVVPGRMGMPGATSWTLTALALLLLCRRGKTHPVVPVVGLLVLLVSGLSITGYLFGADTLYTLPKITAIALQTATMLFALGIGVIATASDRQPMRTLTEDSSAGDLARGALPMIIIVPVILGFLCIRGQSAGLYDASMGSAILILSLIVILCAVLWRGVFAVRLREESLRRSEERFTRFMQHLPGLAWIKDHDGRYQYVNEAAAKAFRTPKEKLLGKTDEEIFPSDIAAQFRQNDNLALVDGTGVVVVETLKQEDGVHHSIVSKFPIAGPTGEVALIGGMAVDITDRKRAEETVRALLRISERLNSTLDVDELLDILVQEALALIGAEAGVAGLLAEKGMVCKKYFQKGVVHPLEYCWPPMHGLPGWLIVHQTPYVTNDAKSDPQIVQELCDRFGVWSALSTPIVDARGGVIGFFEIHNKIDRSPFSSSDQEILLAVSQVAAIAVQNALAYRALQDAQVSLKDVDRRKDEFLAVLAHELRNPLAPIRSGLDIFKRSQFGDPSLNDVRQAMERQVMHLVRLVDDLLDLSRISRDKLELRKERIDLVTVIRQAVETSQPLADCENQSIELDLPTKPLSIEADAVRLAQVFSNLLNNACKFSAPKSKIVISATREGSDLVVSVKDAGIGIPPEKLLQVFEMFTQIHQSFDRSHGGLGIGLTLVKRLVEMHGGNISAYSDGIGKGSNFVIRLPSLVETQDASEESRPNSSSDVSHATKILIVDDNHDAARTLGMLMKLMGHETALAHDGVEAFETAESYRPQVILLDIGLPRMNGYDTCRAIRENPWGRDIVIIALTGWGQEEDRRQSSEAGFNGHLVKPIDHDELVKLISNLLPQRPAATEAVV